MRLVVIADLHDEELVLDRLRALESKRDFDYLLIAGDLGNNYSYAEELSEILSQAFYVPGNNENKRIIKLMEEKGFLVHEKRVELKEGLNLVGFGYSNLTPFHTPGEMREEEMYERLSKLDIDENSILLTHCPPKGVLDNGFGCSSIRKILEEKKPFLHFFGHIHEVVGKQRFKSTLCVNVPPAFTLKAAYVEIKEKHVEVLFDNL